MPQTHKYTTAWYEHRQEELEDTKGVIRIRISKKKRQHNGRKKMYKRTTTIYKTYIYN